MADADIQEVNLEPFYGVYRGFSPTDESPIGAGELEVTIDGFSIKARMATGLKIDEAEIPVSDLEPMTRGDFEVMYEDVDKVINDSTGFKSEGGMSYIFGIDSEFKDYSLVIVGGLGDLLGPTILFGPKQIERGLYEQAVKMVEQDYGETCFPTLENNSIFTR